MWGRFNEKMNHPMKRGVKHLCSRISFSKELTDKGRLYDNIVSYCSKNKVLNVLIIGKI